MTEPIKITKEEFAERRASQREAEKKAEREAREEREKESARADWIAMGGSEEGFEEEWPELRNAMLAGEVLARRQQAQEASRKHMRATF